MRSESNDQAKVHRVTIRDIAKEAGVHFTTVGLALRGSPKLNAQTRERITALAYKMGYRPDPMLSALSAYRVRSHRPVYKATLAWINNWVNKQGLYDNPTFRDYYAGARERAEELGFHLEEFCLKDTGMTSARLLQILRARNIEGVLIAPQEGLNTHVELDASQLATVVFGYSIQPPKYHLLTNHHFHSMILVLERLAGLGYTRVGFVGERLWNDRVENAWVSALSSVRWRDLPIKTVPPLLCDGFEPRDIARWLSKHRPDAVISYSEVLEVLREMKWSIPDDIGFASLCLDRKDRRISGIYQNDFLIGKTAVDILVGCLHRSERGIPEFPLRVLIESEWREGTTLTLKG